LLALFLLAPTGCAYRIGSGLVRGALDEAAGSGKGDGVEDVGDQMLERALLVQLGHQLGAGLGSGVTELTPEQQEGLERTIDGLLAVATRRAGKGIRNEVSPELREMIHLAIVQTLSDGLRGELGDSMEATVDRVVTQAVVALRTQIEEERTRYALADLLRESIYMAMREGQGGTPAVGETLQFTIAENVLDPLASTVGGITEGVAYQVNASAARTEQLLKGIIGALIIVMGVFGVSYLVRTRQLRRAEESSLRAAAGLRSLDVALAQLDENTRTSVLQKLHEMEKVVVPEEPRRPPGP
jgi:hypothetical protein